MLSKCKECSDCRMFPRTKIVNYWSNDPLCPYWEHLNCKIRDSWLPFEYIWNFSETQMPNIFPKPPLYKPILHYIENFSKKCKSLRHLLCTSQKPCLTFTKKIYHFKKKLIPTVSCYSCICFESCMRRQFDCSGLAISNFTNMINLGLSEGEKRKK